MQRTRNEKINRMIEMEVSNILNYEIRDPRKKGLISVLRVVTDSGLEKSDVYISLLCDTESDRDVLWQIIKSSASFVRRTLASRVQLRVVPYINFILDNSIEYSEKINKILSTINIPKDEE